MIAIELDSLADLFFQLKWSSGEIRHTDSYSGRQVNIWRDLLPRRLSEALLGKKPGDHVEIDFSPGEIYTNTRHRDIRTLSRRQFAPERIGAPDVIPRMGRFYPKGVLKDLAGIYRENREAFRCVGLGGDSLEVDLGHPVADRPLALRVTVGAIHAKKAERGGNMRDWMEVITRGVGMQAPWRGVPTDFADPAAFSRQDETADTLFYGKPRIVQHLDDTALEMVRALYDRFIHPGMRVLDLMASWDSHVSEEIPLKRMTGIGLNADELALNKRLTDHAVQDLNQNPTLDIAPGSYDAAICTASVEYLIDPVAVMIEVGRLLKPGGHFIVTFTNRWFSPKAIRLWSHLHEFERMGLVLEYFRSTGIFTGLQTYSLRGLDRPDNDKYAGTLWFSDPVYAVWGRKTQ